MMDTRILKYIPASKKAAIRDCYHDDGYWITLNEGWHVEDYFAEHTIHEDTINELRRVIPSIKRD